MTEPTEQRHSRSQPWMTSLQMWRMRTSAPTGLPAYYIRSSMP